MKYEEMFPSLKDNDYCSFDQIQKDKLMAVCQDNTIIEEAIDRIFPCSIFNGIGTLCDEPKCLNCNKNRELKEELGLGDLK